MVLAQNLAERLKERKEKFRAELIVQGMERGVAEGDVFYRDLLIWRNCVRLR